MKKRTQAVLVSGSLAYDQLFFYEGEIRSHLPPSTDEALYVNLRARGPIHRFGGCGGNTVYTLSLLGVQTALCSWLGEDGERYLSYLCELGVDVSNVTVFSDRATPAGVILVDSREDHVLFFGDAGSELELPLPRLHDISCAVITAGIPAHMLNLMRRCRDASVPVLVDPGKIIMDVDAGALLHAITGADTLFLNAYERDLLIRRSGVSFKNIASSVGTVVVTSGSGNVSLHMGSSVSSHPPVHTNNVKDPSGAGDAFLAGYCCGRLKGLGPEECIKIACTAASFAVEATGTQDHSFNSDTFQNRLEHSYGRQHFNL